MYGTTCTLLLKIYLKLKMKIIEFKNLVAKYNLSSSLCKKNEIQTALGFLWTTSKVEPIYRLWCLDEIFIYAQRVEALTLLFYIIENCIILLMKLFWFLWRQPSFIKWNGFCIPSRDFRSRFLFFNLYPEFYCILIRTYTFW